MKFCLAFISLSLSLVACTHGDSSPAKPTYSVPSRVSENKPAECPAGVAGTYRASNPKVPDIIIRSQNGLLILSDTKSPNDDLPVNGVPTASSDGSMATAICSGGQILGESSDSTGRFSATISFGSDGSLHMEMIHNGETIAMDYHKI
jgi:hypothetical protein